MVVRVQRCDARRGVAVWGRVWKPKPVKVSVADCKAVAKSENGGTITSTPLLGTLGSHVCSQLP